jgi:hypothetical protein
MRRKSNASVGVLMKRVFFDPLMPPDISPVEAIIFCKSPAMPPAVDL